MSKIIFYNDTGFPYSVLAAAIRSGMLPKGRLPRKKELLNVLNICGVGNGDATVYYLGQNENSDKCLALWSSGNGDMVGRMIKSFTRIFKKNDYRLVRLHFRKSILAIMGAGLSKVSWLRPAGYVILHWAVNSVYDELQKAAAKE